jgi:predicted  nucleic acid-binding Zn-ribbon protein
MLNIADNATGTLKKSEDRINKKEESLEERRKEVDKEAEGLRQKVAEIKVIKEKVDNAAKEAEEGLKEYLRQIRSVIKNLKETPDAFFVRQYGGEKFEITKDGERLLIERAEKHFEDFKNLLQPVL